MRRCDHGVYLPEGETKAWGCQSCYPQGHPETTKAPKFNRRSALDITSSGKLPKCPKCNVPISVALGGCPDCGIAIENDGDQNLRANNKQQGICPSCSSGIHFETASGKKWECADCGEIYDAPSRRHS